MQPPRAMGMYQATTLHLGFIVSEEVLLCLDLCFREGIRTEKEWHS